MLNRLITTIKNLKLASTLRQAFKNLGNASYHVALAFKALGMGFFNVVISLIASFAISLVLNISGALAILHNVLGIIKNTFKTFFEHIGVAVKALVGAQPSVQNITPIKQADLKSSFTQKQMLMRSTKPSVVMGLLDFFKEFINVIKKINNIEARVGTDLELLLDPQNSEYEGDRKMIQENLFHAYRIHTFGLWNFNYFFNGNKKVPSTVTIEELNEIAPVATPMPKSVPTLS